MTTRVLKRGLAGAAIAATIVSGAGVMGAGKAEAATCTWYDGATSHDTWYYEGSRCRQFAGKIAEARMSGNTAYGTFYTYARFGSVQSVGSTETWVVLDYYSGSQQSMKWRSPQAGTRPPQFRMTGVRGGIRSGGAMGVDPLVAGSLYGTSNDTHLRRSDSAAAVSQNRENRGPLLPFIQDLRADLGFSTHGLKKIHDGDQYSIWTGQDKDYVWLVFRSEEKGQTLVTRKLRSEWAKSGLAINVSDVDDANPMTIALADTSSAGDISKEVGDAFPSYRDLGHGLFVKYGSSPDEFAQQDLRGGWRSPTSNYVMTIPE